MFFVKVGSEKKTNYTLTNNNDPFKEVFDNRFDNSIQIIDKNDFILIFHVKNIENKIPEVTDENFKNFILTTLVERQKFDFNKKIFDKINANKFSDES